MSVEVIVPWRGGCPHRGRAWDFLRPRYEWPVTVAECPPGPWVKALAVNPAIERSEADIIVLADADVWCEGLQEAVSAVSSGAPWAIPHRAVHRLTKAGTKAIFGGADWRDQPLTQRPYRGFAGGGYIVAPRDTLCAIPCDPRFVGWGQEDESWALALRCLVGEPWRGTAPLIHFYHPPQERMSRRWGSEESMTLARRYRAARKRPEQMRALVSAGRRAGRESCSCSDRP